MADQKRLFIIDAMAMAYRTFFAIGGSRLTTPKGKPIGAVYGTALFMNRLLTEEKPDYLCVVTDSPSKTFRHDIYKDYKAHRDKMPAELSQQLPSFYKLFEKMKLKTFSLDGYEADDVIGTIAKKFASPELKINIVSGDKDFYQLVSDNIQLYAPKKNERIEIVDKSKVFEKFKCPPELVIDCLALMGDSADNVPGVPGIGEKRAAELVENFGTLESIYSQLDQITAKRQKNALESNKEQAFLSKKLVTIDCDAPLVVNLQELSIDASLSAHNESLLEFYQDFSFKSLVEKIRDSLPKTQQSKEKASQKTKTTESVEVSAEKFGEWVSNLKEGAVVPMVLQWEESPSHSSSLSSIQYFNKKVHEVKVPEDEDEKIIFLSYLGALLADKRIKKLGYGWKKTIQKLASLKLHLVQNFYDLKLADYLLNPNDNRRDLKEIADRFHYDWDEDYGSVSCLEPVYQKQMDLLTQNQLVQVLDEIELPLIPVLADMEHYGVLVDPGFLLEYSRTMGKDISQLEAEIYRLAEEEFNINSTQQLRSIIFEKLKIHEQLGITKIKKTKTGYSTDESVLSQMVEHPLPKAILEYRQLSKLKNTWIDTLPQHINAQTERVHTNFQQTVAATGRLSSLGPNLQNIPMRTLVGRNIRKAFIAPKDHVLLSADYSQVEIRLLAGMANEKYLMEAFENDEDVHRATAAKIFSQPPSEITTELRSRAKAVNFGIIYGMGPQRLAQETGVSLTEAKEFIKKYFEAYPGIKTFTENLVSKSQENGFSTTLTGRRRPIPGIADRNRAIAVRAENIAINAPIQGSAADIIKLAMIKIHSSLQKRRLKAKLILQVHDELVLEVHKKDLDKVKDLVRDGMEHALEFPVPLKVEMGSGQNWFEAH